MMITAVTADITTVRIAAAMAAGIHPAAGIHKAGIRPAAGRKLTAGRAAAEEDPIILQIRTTTAGKNTAGTHAGS